MTMTELADLILVRMHEFAQVQGYSEEFDVNAIAQELGETDNQKVSRAAEALAGRGWITADFLYGGIRAFLKGEGSIAVEQGGNTGIIHEYRHNPQRYLVSVVDRSTHNYGSMSGDNITINSEGSFQSSTSSTLPHEVIDIFDRISYQLRQDTELAEAHRRALLNDLETLRSELQRTTPRMGIIRDLLSTFANIATISDLIIKLNPYLPK